MTTASPFADTPDAVAAEIPVSARPRRKKALVDKLGTVEKPAKKKRVNLNPQQKAWFEAGGYTFFNAERPNPFGGVKHDLWGCWDWIAIHPARPGVLFVQTTTVSNLAARRKKVHAAPETPIILASGNRAQIHAFHQPKGPGTKWEVKIEEVTL